MGNFSWAIPTVPFAHFRNLQRFFISESHKFNGDLNQVVSLPLTAKIDLEWWYSNLPLFNGKTLMPYEPDMVIYSDASLKGWGACCDDVTTRGPWTWADKSKHINELELLGAFYALQVFTEHSFHISVHLYLDNSTSVSYINKCGGTRSWGLCDLSGQVINWCETRNIRLTAFHLPGSLNFIADRESRICRTRANGSWTDRFSPALGLFGEWRSICLPARETHSVRILVPSTPRPDDQRFLVELEGSVGLRFPPIRLDSKVPSESSQGESVPGSCMSVVASAIVVSSPSQTCVGRTENITPTPRSIDEQLPSASPSRRVAHSDRVEVIRRRFRDKGFSEEVIGFLLGSNRSTTNSSYQSAWNGWFNWCGERDFDPLSNNLVNLLQYLANLHSNGYATRTVYVQRSMLSMTLDPLDGRNIGEHPMVIQLMKGCYNVNPPRPRYDSTWDPAVVLDFLAKRN